MQILITPLVSSNSSYLQINNIKCELHGKPDLARIDFHNWADTQISRNVYACHPKNLTEIQSLVVACSKNSVNVRCAGAGHSWGPIFSDDESVIAFMDEMEGYSSGKKVKFAVCIYGSTSTFADPNPKPNHNPFVVISPW